MIIKENPYWLDIIPSDLKEYKKKAMKVAGKWLIFGPKKELHLYIDLLNTYVEEGKFIAAKIARKIPEKDPFPHKNCVICIFTSDDDKEIEKTKMKLNRIDLNPSKWKSEEETINDWLPGGKLRLEYEIIKKKRELGLQTSSSSVDQIGEPSQEEKVIEDKSISIRCDTHHKPGLRPVSPFQLDWIEPRLIDADGRSFFMSHKLHEVLKVMLSKEPGTARIIRGGLSDKTVATLYSGKEIDDPEEARKIAMNFRANLRKTFAKYGLNDPHALIRRGKTLGGYVMGKDWHPKRPLINQTEVKLFFREDLDSELGNQNEGRQNDFDT